MNVELEYAVLRLHDIARLIELEFGQGKLGDDLRSVADRLNEILKK